MIDPAEPIEDQAIDWLVLERSGDASEEELAALAAWLAASPAHRAAYEEAKALWANVGATLKAPGEGNSHFAIHRIESELTRTPPDTPVKAGTSALPLPFTPPSLRTLRQDGARPGRNGGRIRRLSWAAVLLLGAVLARQPLDDALFSDHSTGFGERSQVILPDGSRLSLDTDTAVAIEFTAPTRQVTLRRGRIHVEVTRDNERAFDVVTDDTHIRALGTAFSVTKRQHGGFSLTVTEHAVAVSLRDKPADKPIRVETNHCLSYPGSGPLGRPLPTDVQQETAWQRGKLVFRDQPLRDVVSELGRYLPGRIIIVGDSLATMRVSGVFPLDDLNETLHALKESLGIRSTQLGGLLIMLHA